MDKKMKIETNWIPTDLANVLGTGFGFTPASTPATNSIDFPSFIGLLAEKNFTDLINNDDIRNKNADYIIGSRLYDSVVDVNGGGDYVSVQEALAAGKKRIFLRSGTYILNSDINIGSDTFIVGEDKYNTIIDLNNTYQILTSGDTEYNTGTITVANDDTTIVGSGTVWTTNLAVNDYIVIYGSVYKITEVTDNTHLEIEIPYRGYPESSISYSAGTFINNIELRNFTITGQDTAIAGKASVYLYGIVNSYVANLILKETKLSYGNGVDVRYGFKNIFSDPILMKQFYMDKFGVDNPMKLSHIFNKAQDTLQENHGTRCFGHLAKSSGKLSKISQILFNSIRDRLTDYHKDLCDYGTMEDGEFCVIVNESRRIFLDFTISDADNKLCIEFDGDMWHANPNKYKYMDHPNPFYKDMTAQDIWDKDLEKHGLIKSAGFHLLNIWESEYTSNPEQTLNKCLSFINNHIPGASHLNEVV